MRPEIPIAISNLIQELMSAARWQGYFEARLEIMEGDDTEPDATDKHDHEVWTKAQDRGYRSLVRAIAVYKGDLANLDKATKEGEK